MVYMRYLIIISLLINSFSVHSQSLEKRLTKKSNKIVHHVDKLGGEVLAIYNKKGHKLYIQRKKNGVTNFCIYSDNTLIRHGKSYDMVAELRNK